MANIKFPYPNGTKVKINIDYGEIPKNQIGIVLDWNIQENKVQFLVESMDNKRFWYYKEEIDLINEKENG